MVQRRHCCTHHRWTRVVDDKGRVLRSGACETPPACDVVLPVELIGPLSEQTENGVGTSHHPEDELNQNMIKLRQYERGVTTRRCTRVNTGESAFMRVEQHTQPTPVQRQERQLELSIGDGQYVAEVEQVCLDLAYPCNFTAPSR